MAQDCRSIEKRPQLDSRPVEVQYAHTQRVTPPHPSLSLAGPGTGTGNSTANSLIAMIATPMGSSLAGWALELVEVAK